MMCLILEVWQYPSAKWIILGLLQCLFINLIKDQVHNNWPCLWIIFATPHRGAVMQKPCKYAIICQNCGRIRPMLLAHYYYNSASWANCWQIFVQQLGNTGNIKEVHYWPFVRGIHWWPWETTVDIWTSRGCHQISSSWLHGIVWHGFHAISNVVTQITPGTWPCSTKLSVYVLECKQGNWRLCNNF